MGKCPGCGKDFRSGVLVTLVGERGGIRSARVCKPCATRGIRVVPARGPDPRGATPKRDLTDVHRVVRMLRTYAAAARSTDSAATDRIESAWHGGRAEGLDAAIRCIQQEFGLAELKSRAG